MKHCLFLELVFDPDKKGFFSVSKKETTTDYFEGTLMQVTPEFLETFIKSKKKKEKPEPKDIIETKSKFSGVWHRDLYCNGEKILDLDRDFGCKMEYDKCPLPSDGHWREDIAHRRKQDVTRAQNQKERLEVLQRKDRKLREAKHGKKH